MWNRSCRWALCHVVWYGQQPDLVAKDWNALFNTIFFDGKTLQEILPDITEYEAPRCFLALTMWVLFSYPNGGVRYAVCNGR